MRYAFSHDHVRTATQVREAASATVAWRRQMMRLAPRPVAPPPPPPLHQTLPPLPPERPWQPNTVPNEIRRIIAASAAHFGVEAKDVLGPSRRRMLVAPRHVAMWLLRQRGLSLPQIAQRMKRADHTTALHGVRAVEASDKLKEAATEISVKLKESAALPLAEGEGGGHG
jgi:hypothetical protein